LGDKIVPLREEFYSGHEHRLRLLKKKDEVECRRNVCHLFADGVYFFEGFHSGKELCDGFEFVEEVLFVLACHFMVYKLFE